MKTSTNRDLSFKKEVSFTAFLLCILSITYMVALKNDESEFMPFNGSSTILARLYFALLLMTTLISLIVSLSEIRWNEEK